MLTHAFVYLLYAAGTVLASVSVVTPLDEQLPNIARTGQPFSWTFSAHSFESSANSGLGALSYTAGVLPDWLSFDSGSRTLRGTPSAKDGKTSPTVTITAHDEQGKSSESSSFEMMISSREVPTVKVPIEQQFHAGNPSLSSVFIPATSVSEHPSLRIPSSWSFSIGFQDTTLKSSSGNVYYDVRQADGSPIPSWMVFNPREITLNGVTPRQRSSFVVSLALHGSDEKGYTSSALPFDVLVQDHEMYLETSSLPTINITASTAFSISLTSPSDFAGVLVDGEAVQPLDVAEVDIDISHHSSWLHYDKANRTLSGTPPNNLDNAFLPVTLRATFNQTLITSVSLAVVPSYFSGSELDPIIAGNDRSVSFDLSRYYSDHSHHDDSTLSAAFSPKAVSEHLKFDPTTGKLSGSISDDFAPTDPAHVTVTFTAFSHITHSTSHATLHIQRPLADHTATDTGVRRHKTGLSTAARARLIVGLGATFGAIGGLVLLGCLLALFRRYARVKDSADGGVAGQRGWTEKDKKWYGVDTEGAYGFANEKLPNPNSPNPFEPVATPRTAARRYGDIGLGIQRILRTPSSIARSSPRSSLRPRAPAGPRAAVMSKAEFMGKIRETVRVVSDNVRNVSETIRKTSDTIRTVSDKYTKKRPRRPIIGKPMVLGSEKMERLPTAPASPNPFDDAYASTVAMTLSDSPTASTEDRSIPTRRSDFTGVRSPMAPPAAVFNATFGRPSSVASMGSEEYAAEAVIQTATRATSVKSGVGKRTSLLSYSSLPDSPAVSRPRLVPFTSETRVPVPAGSSTLGRAVPSGGRAVPASRVPSQKATVLKNNKVMAKAPTSAPPVQQTQADELNVSMHYVRALGGESPVLHSGNSTPTVSTNALTRSSFSSLDSSEQSHETTGSGRPAATLKRMVIRTGERFKFKVKVMSGTGPSVTEARLLSGRALPRFLGVDLRKTGSKGNVEFTGVAESGDVGEMNVGIYVEDGRCVARLILEVSEKKV